MEFSITERYPDFSLIFPKRNYFMEIIYVRIKFCTVIIACIIIEFTIKAAICFGNQNKCPVKHQSFVCQIDYLNTYRVMFAIKWHGERESIVGLF